MPRCLIVDDDAAVLQALQRLLDRLGCTTRACASGEEAVSVFEHERFDIVMLDLRMPGLDGIETWKQLRDRDPSVPAILMTAAIDGHVLAEGNGMSFLAKPFDVDALRTALDSALAGRPGFDAG